MKPWIGITSNDDRIAFARKPVILPCRHPSTRLQPISVPGPASIYSCPSIALNPHPFVLRSRKAMASSLGSMDAAKLVAGDSPGFARRNIFGRWTATAALPGYEAPVLMAVKPDGCFDVSVVIIDWQPDEAAGATFAYDEEAILVAGGFDVPSCGLKPVRPASAYAEILRLQGVEAMAAAMDADLQEALPTGAARRLLKGRGYAGESRIEAGIKAGTMEEFEAAIVDLMSLATTREADPFPNGLRVRLPKAPEGSASFLLHLMERRHLSIAERIVEAFRPWGIEWRPKMEQWDRKRELGRILPKHFEVRNHVLFFERREAPTAHERLEALERLSAIIPGLEG